jgi:hypothetical protein
MPPQHSDAEIAAFILARGVTRCPTACVAPTRASGNAADRAALRERAERLEAVRAERNSTARCGAQPWLRDGIASRRARQEA